MSISEQVADLQRRIRAARETHARTKVMAEQAIEVAQRTREELRRDFGVSDAGEAARLLQKYQVELREIMAALEQALGEAER